MRVLLHSPKDTFAAFLALAAASAIVTNALFLQAGPHPAPMFGSVVHIPPPSPATVGVLPRPRPAEADVAASEPRLAEPHPGEIRPPPELKGADPLGYLVKTTTGSLPSSNVAPQSNVPRPPAPIPATQLAGSHRVVAVQRALSENGFGQLKADGVVGADTQAAIQKFERDRRMPVTGQVSDRLVRELAAMVGHTID